MIVVVVQFSQVLHNALIATMKGHMYESLIATILQRAAMPRGFDITSIDNPGRKAVDRQCRKLEAQGLLFRAKLSHRVLRWFSTKLAADRAMDIANSEEAKRKELASASKSRMQAQGDPIITEHTKITICPPFVPRWQSESLTFSLQRGRVTMPDLDAIAATAIACGTETT